MSEGLEAFNTVVEMFNQYANKPNDIGEFFKFATACEKVEKELKVLEIIMKYGHFDFYTGELIVNVPVDKEEDYDLLKEVVRNE